MSFVFSFDERVRFANKISVLFGACNVALRCGPMHVMSCIEIEDMLFVLISRSLALMQILTSPYGSVALSFWGEITERGQFPNAVLI